MLRQDKAAIWIFDVFTLSTSWNKFAMVFQIELVMTVSCSQIRRLTVSKWGQQAARTISEEDWTVGIHSSTHTRILNISLIPHGALKVEIWSMILQPLVAF